MYHALVLAPLLCLLVIGWFGRKHLKELASLAWAATPAILLVLLGMACYSDFIKNIEDLVMPFCVISGILACCSIVSLNRTRIWGWFDHQSQHVRHIGLIVLVSCTLLLCSLLVETPYNSLLLKGGVSFFWLELVLCSALLLALFFLGQRHAAACIPAVAFFAFTGVAQHYVSRFKKAAIHPVDLLVLDTAEAVAGSYDFSINAQLLNGFVCLALAICALSLIPLPHAHPERRLRTAMVNLGLAVAWGVFLGALVIVPSYKDLGVTINYWLSLTSFQRQGFYPSFINLVQQLPIPRPADYSPQKAADIQRDYAATWHAEHDAERTKVTEQFETIQPSLIVIMDESFSDLSIYDGMHAGYTGPNFFKNEFSDTILRGTLNVPVHGGGTCNSEFEFLTGIGLSFLGAGKYPYCMYSMDNIDALPQQMHDLGYHTVAMHPFRRQNWKRDVVYPSMGFDEFLSEGNVDEELHGAKKRIFHNAVSDATTYEIILQRLESDERPQFIFEVTMANHGPFTTLHLPKRYTPDYEPADYSGDVPSYELNEYLGCIAKSDDDLKDFIEKLSTLSRPVMVVFFGDHQPTLSMSYNDAWYTDEPEDVHARRAFSTCYAIWTNYEVAGHDATETTDETCVSYLAAQTLDLLGAPLTEYQAAQLALRQQMPALATTSYQSADRTWHGTSTEDDPITAYNDLSLMEYLNFCQKL